LTDTGRDEWEKKQGVNLAGGGQSKTERREKRNESKKQHKRVGTNTTHRLIGFRDLRGERLGTLGEETSGPNGGRGSKPWGRT